MPFEMIFKIFLSVWCETMGSILSRSEFDPFLSFMSYIQKDWSPVYIKTLQTHYTFWILKHTTFHSLWKVDSFLNVINYISTLTFIHRGQWLTNFDSKYLQTVMNLSKRSTCFWNSSSMSSSPLTTCSYNRAWRCLVIYCIVTVHTHTTEPGHASSL
jgi:hypothetical protein